METILAFHNVAKSYGKVRALQSLCFAVRRGEIVALLGRRDRGAGRRV